MIAWPLRNENFLPFQFFAELVKRISGRDREAAEKYEILAALRANYDLNRCVDSDALAVLPFINLSFN